MKRTWLKKVIGVSLTAVLAFGLVACGDDTAAGNDSGSATQQEATDQGSSSDTGSAGAADQGSASDTGSAEAADQGSASDSGSSEAAGLVGSWTTSDFTYTFNADGTGNYDAAGTKMNFDYEDKGDSVFITFEGNTAGEDHKYTIEGDTLKIADSFGEMVEYTRS